VPIAEACAEPLALQSIPPPGANNSSRKCGQNNDMQRIIRFCRKPCSPIWHIGGIDDNQVAAM